MVKKSKRVTLRPKANEGYKGGFSRPTFTVSEVGDDGKTLLLMKNGEFKPQNEVDVQSSGWVNLNFAARRTHTYDKEDKRQKKLIEAFKRNPNISVPGPNNEEMNPNCVNPVVELIDHEEQNKNYAMEAKLEAAIVGIVNNLSHSDLINVAYALGYDPKEMDNNEVFVTVLNEAKDRGKEFLEIVKDTDKYRVIATKAIKYEVIKKERGQLKYGNDVIASADDDDVVDSVASYLRKNTPQYSNIREKVAQVDVDYNSIEKDQIDVISEDVQDSIKKVLGEPSNEEEADSQEEEEKPKQAKKGNQRRTKQKAEA